MYVCMHLCEPLSYFRTSPHGQDGGEQFVVAFLLTDLMHIDSSCRTLSFVAEGPYAGVYYVDLEAVWIIWVVFHYIHVYACETLVTLCLRACLSLVKRYINGQGKKEHMLCLLYIQGERVLKLICN